MFSLVILLPRSMQEEAGYHKPANIFVRQAYQVTSAAAPGLETNPNPTAGASTAQSYGSSGAAAPLASSPWVILGERLNLEKDEVRELIANNQMRQDEEDEAAMEQHDLAPFSDTRGRGRAF
ncbi:hypothetical protein QFC22_005581 [Naganishia vaughanmartiniae]|uniref:Uncharacterized protein n=1 Tax=Naganishia vaughanmartiniae TaxID=1424756 RepID=A0ACC2WU64_9TREE|nr:hypothetical protein QFC22_005581 [Naganishia vaughanmartiniae]